MTSNSALVLTSPTAPLSLQSLPIPIPTSGSVTVRVLATYVLSYMREVLTGARPYKLIHPLVPGSNAIGRIHAIGPDTTAFSSGQLVYCDITIRARDDPSASMLLGYHGGMTPSSIKLMEGEWRNSTYAQYAHFPLENVYALDEERLLGNPSAGIGFGYEVMDLCWFAACLVPFGGLSDIGLKPGETIIVAPATGRFGGGAVTVALAMGARVIAAGRNAEVLGAFQKTFGGTGRLQTVALQGDVAIDSQALMKAAGPKGADAYIDFSPPAAAKSTHIMASLMSLKTGGRCSLMGGIGGNIEIPYIMVMFKNLKIQGKFMYERKDVEALIRMLEAGNLKLGKDAGVKSIGPYGLADIEKAMDEAARWSGWGNTVILMP